MTQAIYWHVRVDRRELIEAIGIARTRAALRRKGGIALEAEITLTAWEGGLSVRSSDIAYDLPAQGAWASPVRANGPALRRLAPKLEGPEVDLRYEEGRLRLNGTSIPARET